MKSILSKGMIALSVLGFAFSVNTNIQSASRGIASDCEGESHVHQHSVSLSNQVSTYGSVLSYLSAGQTHFIQNLKLQYKCERIERSFSLVSGQLISDAQPNKEVLRSYAGVDSMTGDIILLNDLGDNKFQYIISFCKTGDDILDGIFRTAQPQITSTFTGDLNVPNPATCPMGRVNSGDIFFGYSPGGIPLLSRFQPPVSCF